MKIRVTASETSYITLWTMLKFPRDPCVIAVGLLRFKKVLCDITYGINKLITMVTFPYLVFFIVSTSDFGSLKVTLMTVIKSKIIVPN